MKNEKTGLLVQPNDPESIQLSAREDIVESCVKKRKSITLLILLPKNPHWTNLWDCEVRF